MADSFITRTRTSIREIAGEPGIHAKYTDARLLTWIENAYAHIIAEVNRRADNALVQTFDVTPVEYQRVYQLPPIIQRVIDMEWVNTDGDKVGFLQPRSRLHDWGPNVTLEGYTLKFANDPPTGNTLRLHYIPSGCVRLHTGAITSAGDIVNTTTASVNTCTVKLAATPTIGTLDNRPNAYAGSIFRVLSASTNDYVQDRVITAYDVTTRIATLSPAFTAALLPGVTVTYEIAPPIEQAVDILVATYVAKTLVGLEGDNARLKTISLLYAEQLRDLSAQCKHFNGLLEGAAHDNRYNRSSARDRYRR